MSKVGVMSPKVSGSGDLARPLSSLLLLTPCPGSKIFQYKKWSDTVPVIL